MRPFRIGRSPHVSARSSARYLLTPIASDEEILEFTYVTCTYDMHATMSRALRLEFDDVDERIVEIPAPTGSSADVMSMVDTDKKKD